MPPTNTPGSSGGFGNTTGTASGAISNPGGAASSPSANKPTLPARDANRPARDLDPSIGASAATGTLPTDMSRSYEGESERELGGGMGGGGMGSGTGSGRRIGEQAGELTGQAREQVARTYDQVRSFTNDALGNARRQWSESRGRVAERAQAVVGEQKDRLCKGIDDAVQAARAAAEKLEERDDPTVASYARAAADTLERAKDYLGAAQANDLMDDVRSFARRNPEWILGGMFVAGIALARFMKADRMGPRGRPPQGADDSLYRDVMESQFDDEGYYRGRGYGVGGYGADEFGDYGDDYGDRGYGGSSYTAGGGTMGRRGQADDLGAYGAAGTYDTDDDVGGASGPRSFTSESRAPLPAHGGTAGGTRSSNLRDDDATDFGDDVLGGTSGDVGRGSVGTTPGSASAGGGLSQPGAHAGAGYRAPTTGGQTGGGADPGSRKPGSMGGAQ